VVVVGAGIGGLAVARALRSIAGEVVVLERAPVFAPLGAGIVLAANAVNALRALGVDPAAHGRALESLEVRTASGALLSSVDPVEVCPEAPVIGIHRAALHEALLVGLRREVDLRLGRTVARLIEGDGSVRVEIDDGTVERCDLLVAADGIQSEIRSRLGGPDPVYCGYTCWRAVVADPGMPGACEWWGRGRRFGAVPLPGRLAYLYLTLNAPPDAPTPRSFPAMFEDFEEPVRELVRKVDPRTALHHDLSDLPGTFWGRGRVWLLGDAAHATLPNEGQGAAMAVEDAVALRAACSEPEPARAYARYVATRDARVRRIQRDSRWLGWVGQWESPLGVALRDLALRRLPTFVARRQLRSVVAPGLELADWS
jgi:2-polyprenyl-6-methoxyphenol hydroxylase-like FAD-dependent oxidoreductase